MQKCYVFLFYMEKKILLQEMMGGGEGAGWADAPLLPPFLYGPDRLSVLKRNWHLQIFIKE